MNIRQVSRGLASQLEVVTPTSIYFEEYGAVHQQIDHDLLPRLAQEKEQLRPRVVLEYLNVMIHICAVESRDGSGCSWPGALRPGRGILSKAIGKEMSRSASLLRFSCE
jgi:hypothetical protein